MHGFRERDLPPKGGTRKAPRRVSWPTRTDPHDWVCLSVRPTIFATHWCPGASEKGAQSKGRSAPCFAQGCPRCGKPEQFPPQELLGFSALDPQGALTTCIMPGHLADDVAAHPEFTGQWRGAVLTVSRMHMGRSAGVYLAALSYLDGDGLAMPGDHVADLEVMWKPFLDSHAGPMAWHNFGDRDPGQEG